MPAGSITDDTEQALLVADLLIEDRGRIDPGKLAVRLADWEDRMRERGSLDLLGPSTRKAVQAVLHGTPPALAGTTGTTNGAAMRIAPVGIAVPSGDLTALLDRVEEACLVSHATSIAISGAAAVAAAVSAAVDGQPLHLAMGLAIRAARQAVHRGSWVAGADVGARIAWVLERAARRDPARGRARARSARRDEPRHPGVGALRLRGPRPASGRPVGRMLRGRGARRRHRHDRRDGGRDRGRDRGRRAPSPPTSSRRC